MSVVPRDQATATRSPQPYVLARDLRFATKEGPVFGPVDLSFERSRLAVVHGPAGSGRSTLLLALSGRLRGWTGTATVAGLDAERDQHLLRRRTSIARLGDFVELEGRLRVGESVTERALADGVRVPRTELAIANAERRLGRPFPRNRLVEDLDPLESTLLEVVLATLRPSRLIFLDDADRSLDVADQRRLYAELPVAVPSGVMIVLTTLEPTTIPPDVPTHELAGGSR